MAEKPRFVVAQYGPNSPEVAESCPQGRTSFRSAPDDRLAQHLETMKNGAAAHVADLGAPLLTAVTIVVPAWDTIFALWYGPFIGMIAVIYFSLRAPHYVSAVKIEPPLFAISIKREKEV